MNMLNQLKTMSKFKKPDGVGLGKIPGLLTQEEILTEGQLNHHVHIVGASGFGKTVLISHIVKDRIEKDRGLLFLDLKGDIETIHKFTGYAVNANRQKDLMIFSLSDQDISLPYNLIQDGTPTQLRDKIMLSLNWSEEFYKNQSASFLLKLLIGLCWLRDNTGLVFTLSTVLKATESLDFIQALAERIPEERKREKLAIESCYNFLTNKDNSFSLQGLRTQLESLVLSDFGELISSSKNGINLFHAIRDKKIIFIFLDSRRYGESAKAIGKFIIQDLKMVSSRIDAEILKDSRDAFSVIIDEFADLAGEDFIGFLDRARSSKISITVAHQEICDLLRISPEFAGRLMGNTSTLYAFLQKRPESAELISSIAGTKKVWKETHRSEKMLFFDMPTGDKSIREVEEFNIHPNTIKSFGVGACVCVKKYPTAKSYVVRVRYG
ncbi:MAG: TraM recognition domain-containing protein, partial [Bdellovibrio sp.]|nr:TraM recognition domain-containing protein [Bdellovibrio sp.]